MRGKMLKNTQFPKRYVCQLGVAPKSRRHIPLLCFLIQTIDGNFIFSHSLAKLANIVQDQKVDKHTSRSRGRLTDQKKALTAIYATMRDRCASTSFLLSQLESLIWPHHEFVRIGRFIKTRV